LFIDLFIFFTAKVPLVGQGLIIIEVLRSHSDTPLSVGLLWTSDQSDAETSARQHTTLRQTDIHASGGIRNRNSIERPKAHALTLRRLTSYIYHVPHC
jgi:hypothetical protein